MGSEDRFIMTLDAVTKEVRSGVAGEDLGGDNI